MRRIASRMICLAVLMAVAAGTAGVANAASAVQAPVTLLRDREYAKELRERIRGASKKIVGSWFIFKALPMREPGKIAADLVAARKRGVDVTVILEQSHVRSDRLNADNRRTASFLSDGGVRVLFDSEKRVSHQKTAVIDDRFVFVGSHNLTESALRYNSELSVVIDSPALAREVTQYLNEL